MIDSNTRGHKLLTREIEKTLPGLGATDGGGFDTIARVKFFTPDGAWTWLATEYDPNQQLFFGYVLGLENEWGYFQLDELDAVRGQLGLPVERDCHFIPSPVGELI